jgi:hypothetical protein
LSGSFPTPDPGLNAVLRDFVTSAQAILGDNFIAAYLQGSFAVGDWDADSDVDFLIAIDHDVPEADVTALQAMHGRVHHLPSPWAAHLEGSYFPAAILRRADHARTPTLFLDNGSESLIWSDHDNTMIVRWVVREYGIALAGPTPDTLIDPVSADDLKTEVRATMREWASDILAGRYQVANQWAWPFVVLTYCRMLHTLQTGRVGSKRAGAAWANSALESRWVGFIERAWAERPNPPVKVRQPADPADVERTLAFMRYALARGG